MDMFREQFKFNLMARDGRPLASKTTTKGALSPLCGGEEHAAFFGNSVSWQYH